MKKNNFYYALMLINSLLLSSNLYANKATSLKNAVNDKFNKILVADGLIDKNSGSSSYANEYDLYKESPDKKWAFGSITVNLGDLKLYEVPRSEFFIAQFLSNNQWKVYLSGEDEFKALLNKPQTNFFNNEIKPFIPKENDSSNKETDSSNKETDFSNKETDSSNMEFSLPWESGVEWQSGGGPHGWSKGVRPFNSLDFNGGDGTVRAAADGTIYKSCVRGNSAIVNVLHQNGYSTRYYHMTNITNKRNGSKVYKGEYLGKIGNEVPCGGFSTGPHVHFSLYKQGEAVAVNNHTFGGWTFFEGDDEYKGSAKHHNRTVYLPGGSLFNYSGSDQTSFKASTSSTPLKDILHVIVHGGAADINIYRSPFDLKDGILEETEKRVTIPVRCYSNSGHTYYWLKILGKPGWIKSTSVGLNPIDLEKNTKIKECETVMTEEEKTASHLYE